MRDTLLRMAPCWLHSCHSIRILRSSTSSISSNSHFDWKHTRQSVNLELEGHHRITTKYLRFYVLELPQLQHPLVFHDKQYGCETRLRGQIALIAYTVCSYKCGCDCDDDIIHDRDRFAIQTWLSFLQERLYDPCTSFDHERPYSKGFERLQEIR